MQPVFKTIAIWAHTLAAGVFLLFSASLFVDLILRDVFHGSINPVFTFLTNRAVMFIGASTELVAAICCWKYRGRDLINVAILTYVGVILWYRWAFHYSGGFRCNCAGILGKLFHISKANENMIPIIALIILTGTTIPWMIFQVRNGLAKLYNKSTLLVVLLFVIHLGRSAQFIEVSGSYSAAHYNPKTGAVYRPPLDAIGPITNDFKVLICGAKVRICVTNRDDRAWWAEFVYDGTNSFTLNSYDFRSIKTNFLKPDISAYATVSPTPYLVADVEDNIGLALPWLAYGFQPGLLTSNQNGVVEIPLPWMAARQDLFAFGYRWNITPSLDGRFADHLAAIRDQSLDLPENQELLRPEVRYPTGNLAMRDWLLQKVRIRRQIASGFPGGRYECVKWWQTNGVAIPMESDLKYYWKGYPTRPTYEAMLAATDIRVGEIPDANLMPVAEQATLVYDYRVREVRMPLIYEWAEYTNKPGEAWKPPNDPYITASVESYFKHGPRYDSFGGNSRRLGAIVVFAMILLPLPVLFLWRANKKNKTQTK